MLRTPEGKINYREVIDLPEKGAMIVGGIGLAIGTSVPGMQFLILPSVDLMVGGGVSLGVTRGVLPKRQ